MTAGPEAGHSAFGEPRAFLPHLTAAVSAVDAVLAAGDLEAAVPACPGWDLRRLAWHLGGVQRWARVAILERRAGDDSADGPVEREPLRQWFSDGAQALLATLAETDPGQPVWAFGPRPSTAAFWFRRQAHEAAMHAWDAQASQRAVQPIDVRPIDVELATDGIDEVVRMFFPRQVRLARIPALTRSLALEVPGARWVLAGDGLAVVDDAEATVRGTASELLLLLWHRLDRDPAGWGPLGLELDGDPSAARDVLSAAITP